MSSSLFFELSVIIILATAISVIMRLIKQPLIIGYILTGIIAGPLVLDLFSQSDIFTELSHIGIALLLFIVGLKLNIKTLKEVGIPSVVTGVGQVILTTAITFAIMVYFGFSNFEALFIGLALSFSSTIIIIKLLSDKKDIDSLYGKLSVGYLIVQDLIVVLVLMFVASFNNDHSLLNSILITLLQGTALIFILFFTANVFMPHVLKFMARSQELLFLFSVAWVLVLALLFDKLGFGIEIGALFAGVCFAGSTYQYSISSKIKPLRDFFITLFFIILGSQIAFSQIGEIALIALLLTVIVLVLKPLIFMYLFGILGFHKHTGFYASVTGSQISEFSLILAIIFLQLGMLTQNTVSIVTIVGLLTIAGSTYLIMHTKKIYDVLSPYLNFLNSNNHHDKKIKSLNPHIILFGHNRIGYSLLKSFVKIKKRFLVVDFNPEIIRLLRKKDVPCKYGDAEDVELLDSLNLDKIKMAISTIPEVETNLLVIEKIREVNKKAIIIITSHQVEGAMRLYKEGADYVLMPHFLGGTHASALVEKCGTDINKFIKEKYKHIKELQERKHFGHEHPEMI